MNYFSPTNTPEVTFSEMVKVFRVCHHVIRLDWYSRQECENTRICNNDNILNSVFFFIFNQTGVLLLLLLLLRFCFLYFFHISCENRKLLFFFLEVNRFSYFNHHYLVLSQSGEETDIIPDVSMRVSFKWLSLVRCK